MVLKATAEEKAAARLLPFATCTICKETKPRSAFITDEKKTNGLLSNCRSCRAVQAKRLYDKNRDILCAKKRAKEAEDPETTRANRARWRLANRENRKRRNKERYAANREKAKALLQAWIQANPERHKAAARKYKLKWRLENPERYRERAMRAYEKRRALKFGAEYEPIRLKDVIEKDGLHCYICGRLTDPLAPRFAHERAELEHVLSLSKGGTHTQGNLRCACWFCNRSKGSRFTPEETRERIFAKRPARRFIRYVAVTRPSKRLIVVGA